MALATSISAAIVDLWELYSSWKSLIVPATIVCADSATVKAFIPCLRGHLETGVKPSYHLIEANEKSSGILAGLHLGVSAMPTAGLEPATLRRKVIQPLYLSSHPLSSWQPVMHMPSVVLFTEKSSLVRNSPVSWVTRLTFHKEDLVKTCYFKLVWSSTYHS